MLIPSLIFRTINKAKRRKLWLVAEEGEARDNGYHFYKYVRENHPDDYCFYAIKSKSAGYKKVVKLGNIIKFGGLKHWLYYMSANLNISSQTSGNPSNFFWYFIHVPLGLYRNRVFLQHGITYHNADCLHFSRTKFRYFVTGAEQEYKEIANNFGYKKGSVLFTGFPRWDALETADSLAKSILIMPTWRKKLQIQNNALFTRNDFVDSEYFKAWNGLLNNKEFLKFIDENNIDVYFYPHQNVQKMLYLFDSPSKRVKFISMDEDISKFLSGCSLLITDYSSVMFDFAYLKKPVLCYQFDEEDFHKTQHGLGYFNYRKNGFGPVLKSDKLLVNHIKKIFHDGNEPRYIKNAERFFGDQNGNNSKKLYNCLSGKKEKLKVLQVVNSMNVGGLETFIMNLYRNIDRSKFEFVFLANVPGKYDYQDEIEKMGGRIVRIETPTKWNRIKHLRQLNKVIKQLKPDVIHCHTYYDAFNVMLVSQHNHVPVRITHSHTTFGYNLNHRILRNMMSGLIRKKSNVLLACGKEAGLALYKKDDFVVLPNGIEIDKFGYNNTKREQLRKKMNIRPDEIVIGHVGRLVEVKNHKFLLDIAEKLKDKKQYRFIFVGDGPLKGDIKKIIKQCHLENVLLLGNVNNTSELYNVFDIFVFPSIYEGIPLALIEAQANGLPIIASNTIDNAVNVSGNIDFLSLSAPKAEWITLIENKAGKRSNNKIYDNRYDISKIVEKIEYIYMRGQ